MVDTVLNESRGKMNVHLKNAAACKKHAQQSRQVSDN
jgi:hypothetical protein